MSTKLDAMKDLLIEEAEERATETSLLRMMTAILSQEIAERASDNANIEKALAATIQRLEKQDAERAARHAVHMETMTKAAARMADAVTAIEGIARTLKEAATRPAPKGAEKDALAPQLARLTSAINDMAARQKREPKPLEFIIHRGELGGITKITAKET